MTHRAQDFTCTEKGLVGTTVAKPRVLHSFDGYKNSLIKLKPKCVQKNDASTHEQKWNTRLSNSNYSELQGINGIQSQDLPEWHFRPSFDLGEFSFDDVQHIRGHYLQVKYRRPVMGIRCPSARAYDRFDAHFRFQDFRSGRLSSVGY